MYLVMNKLKNLKKINAFTHYNLLVLFLSINYNIFKKFYPLCYCWSYLIFISFNSANLLDKTAFKRLAVQKKINILYIHIGNNILHTIPLIYISYNIPDNVTIYHALIALKINLLWCYLSSYKTFELKYLYLSFSKKNTIYIYFIAYISCIMTPFIYKMNKIILNNIK